MTGPGGYDLLPVPFHDDDVNGTSGVGSSSEAPGDDGEDGEKHYAEYDDEEDEDDPSNDPDNSTKSRKRMQATLRRGSKTKRRILTTPVPLTHQESSRTRQMSAGKSIAEAIKTLASGLNPSANRGKEESWSLQAVEIFYHELDDQFCEDDVGIVMQVLENDTKAGMFCKVPPNRRKAWLQQQILAKLSSR